MRGLIARLHGQYVRVLFIRTLARGIVRHKPDFLFLAVCYRNGMEGIAQHTGLESSTEGDG